MNQYQDLLARHDYAIIDRTIIGAEDWHDELPLQDIVPKQMKNDVERTPKLLQLEMGAPHMARVIENLDAARKGREEYLFSCLLSAPDVAPDKMMLHLRKHLVFASKQGNGVLRFYDGRVFPHLLRMLYPSTLGAIFVPIRHWTFRLQDEWISVPPPETNLVRRYWALDDKERQRVDRIHRINQTLSKWQQQHKRPWKDLDEFHARSEQVEQALLDAKNEAHLQDAGAQIAFALRVIETHEPQSWVKPQ